MAQDREAGENRRSEFLEKRAADDVLDVVRHHGQHGCDKSCENPGDGALRRRSSFGAERFVLTGFALDVMDVTTRAEINLGG